MPFRLVPIGEGRALLYIAGQVPVQDGKRLTGRCPDEVSVEQAQVAARVCALNLLAQMEAAAGLDNVEQVTQLIALVLSADGFGDQPKVINATRCRVSGWISITTATLITVPWLCPAITTRPR